MKKIISLFMAFVMLFSVISSVNLSAYASSGTCGENVYWDYDESSKTLTISGNGDMFNSYNKYPWDGFRNDISTVKIEDGVTLVEYKAFSNCGNLTTAIIGDGVKSIEPSAFYNCVNLKNVKIGNSVTTIDNSAFEGCSSLVSIIIPNSVTTIDRAFDSCINLSSVIMGNSVTTITNGAFNECKNLKSITLPDSVRTIGNSAFYGCSSLTSVTIPNSVTTIGNSAFKLCSSLTSVTIGNSVTTIGICAFNRCSSLTSVTIGNSVTTIGYQAFEYCSSLTSVTIPNSVTTIEDCAFNKCRNIKNLVIGNSVITIGRAAFQGACKNLTSLVIPDSVITIEEFAFGVSSNGSKITNLTIGNSVTTIGNHAFGSACESLTSLVIPDSVVTIGDGAFNNGSKITNLTIGNSVTTIGNGAFNNCKGLRSIKIPNSVITIGDRAFNDCSGLRSIEIPNSVTTIGKEAFKYCRGLRYVTIGSGVTKIGEDTFFCCDNLAYIDVNIDNLKYSSDEGVLFNKDKSELIHYPVKSERPEYIVPNSVITIGSNAFRGIVNFYSIEIPDSVKFIKDGAFDICRSLKDVYYLGSEEQWKKISIGSDNDYLLNATIHYNSSLPGQPEIPDKPDSTKLKPQSFKVVKKTYKDKYGFYYTDDYFKKPATKYNQSLATMSLCLALSTYQDEKKEIYHENVKNLFGKCGFVIDGADNTFQQKNYDIKTGTDTIACSFANKKIGDSTLVAVAVRSGGYGAEWASNLTLGLAGDHAGFDDASNKVYEYLADYVNSRNITGKVKFWITGFSRGGATANLLAAKLDNKIDSHPKITYSKEDVYAYTFATPAGAVKSNNPHSKKYNNIFNIINFHDLVPLVAPSQFGWSFDRYGITKVLPFSESNKGAVKFQQKMIKYLNGMGYEYKADKFKSYIYNFMLGYGYNSPLGYATAIEQKNNHDTLGVFNRKFIKSVATQIGGRPAYVLSYQNELRGFVSNNALGIANGVLSEVERSKLITLLLGESTWHPHLTATAIKNFDLLTVVHAENANYLAWMMCMDKNYDPSNHEYFTNGDYRVVKVNCPVDVNVYDESNNLVASIINDVPQQIDGSTIISSIDENEQKVVYLPVDGEYRVEVKARENCQTTYTVNEYTGFSSDLSKVVAYQDVDMKKNETLISNVDSYTNEEISDEEGTTNGSSVDYNLELNNKKLAPEVNATGEEIKSVTYTVNVSYDENQGAASAGGEFTAGDFCLLTATAKEGFAFDGWYIDGKKVSSNASYRFAVKSNVNVEAKFINKNSGSSVSTSNTTETKPNQTQNNSTTSTQKLSIKKLASKRKALVVYWNKIANVSGYQIQVATDKKFKKNKKTITVAKQNASKKTVKKLKPKKKYFVRVRAYKIVDGKKVFGKWSKIKSVKAK